jgi:tellurite methyltransferase
MSQPTKQQPFIPDWSAYYEAVEGRPPRETLLTALNLFESFESQDSVSTSRLAVDLGCGDGRDTVELLQRGWRTIAIDGELEAIARLQNRSDVNLNRLETRVDHFESLQLPNPVDLINASFCLPFCPPHEFPTLWGKIVQALRPGGRFCGQLFGDRDSWAIYPNRTHHTRVQVDTLLIPFEVEWFEEEDHPGRTALGEEKHWHIFNIVARKTGLQIGV